MATVKNELLIRVYVVLFVIVLAAIAVFAKAVKIQVFEGDKWRAKGDSLYVKYKPVFAERGNIMAEDGSMLATSLPFFEIRMDFKSDAMDDKLFEENLDSLAYCLATYVSNSHTVGGYRELLMERKAAGDRYFLIKKNVTYPELQKIKKFPIFNLGRYKGGFIVIRQSKRNRPFRMLAQRTIGYVRDDGNPVGLEGYFNKTLGGEAGKQLMQRVSHNTWIPVNDLTEIEPKNGDDLVTTIDINLQDIVHEALLRGLKHHDANHGTAILMDVKTGAIKAISNIGRTDLGWWETYNYAIGSATEPGSTFKAAAMLALLEDGHVNLDDSIRIYNGKMQFYEEEMVDASSESFKLDTTSVRRAFEISSNVAMGSLVQKHYGKNKKGAEFIKRLKSFNLHLPTGIEIEGEAPPIIKEAYSKEDDWSGTTLPWMSIGYELTVTPLQLLTFYNAVANNGKMMKPYLVSEIQQFGEPVEKIKPTVIKRQIAKPASVQKLQELLEGVVEVGTARGLATNKYRFAGKTGTAQINYRKFKPRANIKYQASFAGYFPAENPVYSCIVLVNEPKEHGFYGGEVAGPIFREIADQCFATRIELHEPINTRGRNELATNQLPNMDVGKREDIQSVLSYLDIEHTPTSRGNWSVVKADADTISLQRRTIKEDVVPNVVGMGLRDALFILENLGLKVVVSGIGKVKLQSIKSGTRIKGQTIKLTLK